MKINTLVRYSFLFIASILFVFPLYWMITGSLKTEVDIWAIPPKWVPSELSYKNFIQLFTTVPALRWLLNSLFTCLITCVLVVLFSAMAGYAYAKKRFPGNKIFFAIVVMTMMMPHQVTLVPLYMLVSKLRLIDTYWGLILPGIAFPFGVFIIRQFVKTLPDEVLEAARIDGASEIRTFAIVVFPLILPALGALSIFVFMYVWNDYLWQLIVLQSRNMLTLPVGISTIAYEERSINYGLAMSGASLAAIPMILFFILLQRSFIKGITLGSVKG